MAVNYIWVIFVPGAAGNFLSRCLQFAEDTVCFADRTNGVPLSAEDKWSLLNYSSVIENQFAERNWKDFESQATPYRNWDMDVNEQNRVWYSHPDKSVLEQGFVKNEDQQTVIYIDPGDQLEWCLLNALYKNSYITVDWLLQAGEIAKRADVIFPLKNMFSDNFVSHIKHLAEELNLTYTEAGIQCVNKLHAQWQTTVCKDIRRWKNQLGFKIDNA